VVRQKDELNSLLKCITETTSD